MATVTVLGASGTITIPFKSSSNALLAQQLANQISAAIQGGTLFPASYNASTFPALPTVVGGAAVGEQVIGGNSPSSSSALVQNPGGYPAIIVNTTNPVTVNGAPFQVAPYSVIGGDGGLTFFGEGSSQGGTIFTGGGQNLLSGTTTPTDAPDSTNGGLVGNWNIGTAGDPSEASTIRLASGNDSITVSGNDTIATGGANALISATDDGSPKPVIFLGSGNVTYFGGSESNDLILGGGIATGNDILVLGRGGNSTVVAGTGNATLIGGGNGDLLFGNTTGSQQQLWGSGNETLLGGGTSSDTFFGFSGISSTGNVFMTAANGSGNNQFWVGAGNDTVWSGLGNDTVFVFADHTTNTSGPAAQDIIFGWDSKDTLWINGYSSATFGTSAAGVTLNLSDGTQVTFAGIADPSTIKIV